MEANIVWQRDAVFSARTDSGHEITVDGPPELGGTNAGPRPMELMLLGVGGCTAFDVVHILRRGRTEVSKCETRVTAKRAETDPKVFTDVHIHFTLAGEGLTERKVARAVELSATRYCSASIMLQRANVTVTHEFDIE